ncbi:hypothetical protein HYALB_00007804 [Hymenoscyphus albidus]|uniref:DUF2293 domain-containing protein n=1 Tax=Hymenoscyphus albidus TaxID=595503 RepID=A0A9N9LGH1_9HELO|nr:hypothetical protein HYALB_00007804 [Hymenoscyphus albidus]
MAKKKASKAAATGTAMAPKGAKDARAAGPLKRMSAGKAERRHKKEEMRRKERREKAKISAAEWAAAPPSHLVARLDMPKVKSKYQSYFEFAENTEKKEKKLEVQITTDPRPPPGFWFVPFGDPVMTNACKELSRERGAMIFVVSERQREASKISAEVHRIGYHFRETIVDEAREVVGETVLTRSNVRPGAIEPIPESQDEINKQADLALRDLFPRIPNTDRQQIIEHAFQKGKGFHGEPTVGLQRDLSLSRRVQLAALAHIRHTHTRYDLLLRETSWVNARKLVESVCLDIIAKWRGDEETGRDQLDEILREVVVITDSEDEDDDSSDDETTDEEDAKISDPVSMTAPTPTTGVFRTQPLPPPINNPSPSQNNAGQNPSGAISSRTRSKMQPKVRADITSQRGFSRYRAAWDEALDRQRSDQLMSTRPIDSPVYDVSSKGVRFVAPIPPHISQHRTSGSQPASKQTDYSSMNQRNYETNTAMQPAPYYHREHSRVSGTLSHSNQVTVRHQTDQRMNHDFQPRFGTPLRPNDQRPVFVRGSSQKTGLQDMLVPSIETVSNDPVHPSVRSDERRVVHESFEHLQESYPRPVMEVRRPSPQRRQVIILDDDSPQYKRQRVHEDESGRFRPHPSFDYTSSTVPSTDSRLLPSSSVQTRPFFTRDSSIHAGSSQGLSGNASYFHSPAGERIPIYDALESGSLGLPSEQYRRPEVYDPRQLDDRVVTQYKPVSQAAYSHEGERVYHRQPVDHVWTRRSPENGDHNRGYKQAEPDYRFIRPQGPQSPSFPVSGRISRSFDVARQSIDQGLVHDFSQSRLEGPVHTADRFSNAPERSRQVQGSQSNLSRGYEEHVSRPFQPPPQARARSPASYVERPM